MPTQITSDTDMLFAPEQDNVDADKRANYPPWKVLIVDDEQGIHDITSLALADFEFDGRSISFLNAYSAKEAKSLLAEHSDIVLALVDVVMETEHAGLDLIHYIRREINNKLIRLVLRTGQPGQAPERTVIRDYDINDYKEKSELSVQKLYTTMYTSLRSYRDLAALDANRRGLEHVIHASGELFKAQALSELIQGVLQQLVALLHLDTDSIYLNCDSLALENSKNGISILAATGNFEKSVGFSGLDSLPNDVQEVIMETLNKKSMLIRDNIYAGYFQPHSGHENIIYITSSKTLSDDDSNLIKLFLHNVSIAYENNLLKDDITNTQREMLYMLGEAIETRSQETGQHVRRVAEYCRLITLGIGLSEREAEILHIAAPLHDFGKIGIPDAILHKPGKLTTEEWEIMKTHAQKGEDMLTRSDKEIFQAAAKLSGQHHEKWDGSGYPRGLSGEDIHIFGRIGAVADVFDALGSRRCYKEPWSIDQIAEFLQGQRELHFDPQIVDWVLTNLDKMAEVRATFPDPGD